MKETKTYLKYGRLFIVSLLLFSCAKQSKTAKEDEKMILPEQSQCFLLMEAGLLSENSSLFIDALGTPTLLMDSLVYSLGNEKTDILQRYLMRFYQSTVPNDICCFDDGTILFTEGEYLCRIQGAKKDTVVNYPFKDIHISRAGNGIYLSAYNKQESRYILFFVDRNNAQIHKLLSNASPLTAIGTGDATIVATDSTVYLLENGATRILFKAPEPVRHLAFAPDGIFYATENNLGYFNPKINLFFLKKKIKALCSTPDELYYIIDDGSLYKITNTEYFNELANFIN